MFKYIKLLLLMVLLTAPVLVQASVCQLMSMNAPIQKMEMKPSDAEHCPMQEEASISMVMADCVDLDATQPADAQVLKSFSIEKVAIAAETEQIYLPLVLSSAYVRGPPEYSRAIKPSIILTSQRYRI